MVKLTLLKCWSGSNFKKVSTVTSSPDLRLRGQRSKKVKSQTTWNDKSKTVNVLILVKHQKKVNGDLFIRPTDKRSKVKKDQISNNFKWQEWHCQCISMCQTPTNVHGDLFVWPTVEGVGIGKTWKVSVITPLSEQLSRVQRCRSKVA